jgi:aspartokinase
VVIDAELGRENYGLIPRDCDWEEVGTTWCQNWPPNQILVVVKAKKQKNTNALISIAKLFQQKNLDRKKNTFISLSHHIAHFVWDLNLDF